MVEHFGDLQTRPQAQRLQVVDLLNDLMSQHRLALRDMADEAMIGIANLVSGEKDPRNLMIIFSILRVIMIEWDITEHAEVFELIACSVYWTDHIVVIRFCVLLLSNHLPSST